MVQEAQLEQTETGLRPAGDGWFVVNVRDARWGRNPAFGAARPLRTWDFVHCPPNTDHVFVGAGGGPCVILMVGARSDNEELFYPVSEVARRHGASAKADTPSPEEAYAPFPEREAARPDSWAELPWA